MPSQTFALLGVNSDERSIGLDHWQIIDSLVLLHCARTPSPLSPPPILMTCISQDRLRTFSYETRIIIGHPSCERLHLDYSEAIDIKTAKPATLAAEALHAIRNLVTTVEEGESLVIILCGHGDTEGNFYAGEDILAKGALEKFVDLCKGKVLVVSTACYSGLWKSDSWELVAAAAADQQSTSVVASASDQFRGSIFASALLAEHYSNSGIAMPGDGKTTMGKDCRLHYGSQQCDFCKLNKPAVKVNDQLAAVLVSKMNSYRSSFDCPLYDASFCHHGDGKYVFPFDAPTSLSVLPFTKIRANSTMPASPCLTSANSIPCFQVIATHTTTSIPTAEPVHDSIPEDGSLWTPSEEEMKVLSLSIKGQGLSTVASNLHAIQYALWFLAGGKKTGFHPVPTQQGTIEKMGWKDTVDPLMTGGPVDRKLIEEAHKSGKCDVSIVTPSKDQWLEPAYWLAKLWKAAGGTPVDEKQWSEAVAAGAIVSV
ncbi:hypothetical protein EV421DRAFT_1909126 [Armillaria borealis]|uniref:Uncharacterized protein n=1 Tax=Armillaria borealis TaxID=47425 RepID=A0AA39J2B0_9AGAR|nr:hypothetical protein EV421DRAFT_1909126 [Armillaria borealis]